MNMNEASVVVIMDLAEAYRSAVFGHVTELGDVLVAPNEAEQRIILRKLIGVSMDTIRMLDTSQMVR